MCAVCCSKCIVAVDIAIGSESLCELRVIALLFLVESDILKKKDLARLECLDFLLNLWSDYIRSELHFLSEKLRELCCDRSKGEVRILLSLRASEVCHNNKGSTVVKDVLDCRECCLDSCSIRYDAVLERYIEIDADKDFLSLEIRFIDCIKLHENLPL